MIELVFTMMMISNGTVIEYVPMGEGVEGMKSCLEQKRIVSRQIGEGQEGIYVKCDELKVELENDMGRLRIKRIIE
tara:strand:+ start:337 stop:564 length:228 start_codon:yes stop_codon:yes gene_type:complete